jgi:hypothetical protein
VSSMRVVCKPCDLQCFILHAEDEITAARICEAGSGPGVLCKLCTLGMERLFGVERVALVLEEPAWSLGIDLQER